MKTKVWMTLAFIATFLLGFAFRSVTTKISNGSSGKKVTGIGGIFLNARILKK